MSQGWIKIHRQIQECDLWDDEEPFDRRSAWIDLLLLANHRDKSTIFDGQPITVGRGQRITSIRKLADRWNWSRDRVLRYLNLLEQLGMIERQSDKRKTLLTIVNYGIFQDVPDSDEDTHKDTDGTVTRTLIRHKQERKNEKNEKNIYKGAFIPPTFEEVSAYCQERNNKVNPQAFIDFYSSKGWMIGKNKMKDWKASVRTWERRESKGPQYKQFAHSNEESELEKELLAN